MTTKAVTDASFDADVLKAGTPVLVDFWAEWCGPCRQIGPALEELAKDYEGRITIVKMDVDKNPLVPTKYGIRSIPALLIFKDGEVISQQVGALPKSRLASWIEQSAPAAATA